MKIYSARAPAKLNLGLRVVGRRADGYHLLESLFWPIDLCDKLEFSEAERDSLELTHVSIDTGQWPATQNNLILVALNQIRLRSNIPFFRVRIEKNIPLGAGLGGGSSDGAATIQMFLPVLGNNIASELAATLGADVPFFVGNIVPAWMTGIGEKKCIVPIAPAALKRISFVIILPPLSVSTKSVFDEFRRHELSANRVELPPGELDWSSLRAYLQMSANDLEPIVSQRFPIISLACRELHQAGAIFSSMSGSGSSVFGVFETPDLANNAAKALDKFCRQYSCRLLTAMTYRA